MANGKTAAGLLVMARNVCSTLDSTGRRCGGLTMHPSSGFQANVNNTNRELGGCMGWRLCHAHRRMTGPGDTTLTVSVSHEGSRASHGQQPRPCPILKMHVKRDGQTGAMILSTSARCGRDLQNEKLQARLP